jgi:HNH endonuclease
MRRDNYICYICGKVMHKDHPELSSDHIVSRAKGGSDLPENQACCCRPCNEEKGNMDLRTFYIATRVSFPCCVHYKKVALATFILFGQQKKEGNSSFFNKFLRMKNWRNTAEF